MLDLSNTMVQKYKSLRFLIVYNYDEGSDSMFGNNLKTVRKARRLTQRELASLVGVSKTTISGWETGANLPAVGTLILLAKTLHTSIDYLLGLTTNRTINTDGLSDKDIRKLQMFADIMKE